MTWIESYVTPDRKHTFCIYDAPTPEAVRPPATTCRYHANAEKTKTFCIYEGPREAAVRKAAELNKLPVDSVTEVPVTLSPK